MPNLTTIAKWSETLGISRQQGYEAVKRCEIPVVEGKVDVEYATMLYQRGTRARANGNKAAPLAGAPVSAGAAGAGGAEPKVPGYDSSRARREAAEAELAEKKLAEMVGKYLLKEDVENQVFEIARALRDGLMNCARRIAADVAGLTSAEECEVVVDREHRALLDSMVQQLGAGLQVHAEDFSG